MKYSFALFLLFSFSSLAAEEPKESDLFIETEAILDEVNISFDTNSELAYGTDDLQVPQTNPIPDFSDHGSNNLQLDNKHDSQVHQLMIAGGYSKVFGEYPGSSIGLCYRYTPEVWGFDVCYLQSGSYGWSGQVTEHTASVTPFIKINITPKINLYLGTGLGASKSKFSHFYDYSANYYWYPPIIPSETYYSLDVSGLFQLSYFLNMKYLQSIGFVVRAIQPSYFFYHIGEAKDFQPTSPTVTLSLLLGF